MNAFLDKIYQLLPILGVRFFEELQSESVADDDWLYCETKGLTAKGRRTG